MYRVFEHTADLGLHIEADSFEELLSEAARALFSLLVVNLDEVQPVLEHIVRLPKDEPAWLLADWLSELLYLFDTRHWIFRRFDVEDVREHWQIRCWGEALDRSRHHLDHEVKAITYHNLSCSQQPDGRWVAELIVDI